MHLFAWRTALPALWLLLADLSPQQEVYAGADYGLSMLAVLGTAGCLSYALALVSDRTLFGEGSAVSLAGPEPAGGLALSGRTARGERWPLLIALLFAPLVILFSGLGGFVEVAPGPSAAP